MAKVEMIPNLDEWDQKEGEDWQTFDERIDDLFDALRQESDKVVFGEKHGIIGYLFRHQIADGYANYVVASVRPLILHFVPWGDAYRLPEAHERGLRLVDIQSNLDFDRAWRGTREEKRANDD